MKSSAWCSKLSNQSIGVLEADPAHERSVRLVTREDWCRPVCVSATTFKRSICPCQNCNADHAGDRCFHACFLTIMDIQTMIQVSRALDQNDLEFDGRPSKALGLRPLQTLGRSLITIVSPMGMRNHARCQSSAVTGSDFVSVPVSFR